MAYRPRKKSKNNLERQNSFFGNFENSLSLIKSIAAGTHFIPQQPSFSVRPQNLLSLCRFRHLAQRFLCVSATRARPSGVRGPVLRPPWFGQRVLPGTRKRLHGRPERVLALHRNSEISSHSDI